MGLILIFKPPLIVYNLLALVKTKSCFETYEIGHTKNSSFELHLLLKNAQLQFGVWRHRCTYQRQTSFGKPKINIYLSICVTRFCLTDAVILFITIFNCPFRLQIFKLLFRNSKKFVFYYSSCNSTQGLFTCAFWVDICVGICRSVI